MDKIAVLIPCYNEGLTIGKVIEDAKKYLPLATIYVYDNNSTDDTFKIASSYPDVIVRKEPKQGKGNVVRSMFASIEAESYLLIDGDDTYELSNAMEMVDKVLNGEADMVVGDRLSGAYYTENKRPFHNFGNNLVRRAVNTLFRSSIKDVMTGMRAFSYTFVKSFPILSKGFEIETEMTVFAISHNLSVTSMTIGYRDRPAGSSSKLNTFKDGFKVLGQIHSMFKTYHPKIYFGILAIILIGLGIGFFIPVFITFFKTGEVPNFPTLICCCFAIFCGIFFLFAGSIFSYLRKMDDKNTEYRFIETKKEFNELKRKEDQ